MIILRVPYRGRMMSIIFAREINAIVIIVNPSMKFHCEMRHHNSSLRHSIAAARDMQIIIRIVISFYVRIDRISRG